MFRYTDTTYAPTRIVIDTDWADVSGGSFHSLALKTNGTLWAWGYNHYGQVGDGTQIDRHSPTRIGTATDWAKVVAGGYHSMALAHAGTVPDPEVELTLQVTGQGTVTPPPGTHTYDLNGVVALEAEADPGWFFSHWEGPVAHASLAQTSVVMTADLHRTSSLPGDQRNRGSFTDDRTPPGIVRATQVNTSSKANPTRLEVLPIQRFITFSSFPNRRQSS